MRLLALSVAVVLCLPVFVHADDLEPISPDEINAIAGALVQSADKLEKPQVKITADLAKANGVHLPDRLGLLVVPQKDLQESEELAAQFLTEKGAAIGYLFAYRLAPVINGQQVELDRLRKVSFTDNDGGEHDIYTLLLSVRQLAGDDYRLYGYGSGEEPVVDASFGEGEGPGAEPVAVEVKNVNSDARQGDAVVTVFGRYQATFRVGAVEP